MYTLIYVLYTTSVTILESGTIKQTNTQTNPDTMLSSAVRNYYGQFTEIVLQSDPRQIYFYLYEIRTQLQPVEMEQSLYSSMYILGRRRDCIEIDCFRIS